MTAKIQPTNVNTNTNVNNNTNIVNVHVPKKKRGYNKKRKPNWIVKAIILGVIGLVLSMIGYYMQNSGGHGKPAVIENGTPAITPNK